MLSVIIYATIVHVLRAVPYNTQDIPDILSSFEPISTLPSVTYGGMALQWAFTDFDRDGDGLIDMDEVKKVLLWFGPKSDATLTAEAEAMMLLFDHNDDGKINLEEFTDAFHHFDVNGDGDIDSNEIMDFLQSLGEDFSFVSTAYATTETTTTFDELTDLFNSYDKDGDGLIDVDELYAVLNATGADMTKEEAQHTIFALDEDSDDKINFAEFWEAFTSETFDEETYFRNLFNFYDKDRDGFIDVDELYDLANAYGDNVTMEEVEVRISQVDTDQDGKINLDEFLKAFAEGTGAPSTTYEVYGYNLTENVDCLHADDLDVDHLYEGLTLAECAEKCNNECVYTFGEVCIECVSFGFYPNPPMASTTLCAPSAMCNSDDARETNEPVGSSYLYTKIGASPIIKSAEDLWVIMFNSYDKDGDGFIDVTELCDLANAYGGNMTIKEAEVAISKVDTNQDKKVDLGEFLEIFEATGAPSTTYDESYDELESVFDKMDRNRDGVITSSELTFGLSIYYGQTISGEEAAVMINEFDTDGDSLLNLDEFIAAYHYFDKNGDGEIDSSELRDALLSYEMPPSYTTTNGEPQTMELPEVDGYIKYPGVLCLNDAMYEDLSLAQCAAKCNDECVPYGTQCNECVSFVFYPDPKTDASTLCAPSSTCNLDNVKPEFAPFEPAYLYTKEAADFTTFDELTDLFNSYDKDGDGGIDVDELYAVANATGDSMTKEEAQHIIFAFDGDSDGEISFAEFFEAFTTQTFDEETYARNFFNFYDKDDDGFIDVNELYDLANAYGDNVSMEEAEFRISQVDTDQDGKINFDEFFDVFAEGTAPSTECGADEECPTYFVCHEEEQMCRRDCRSFAIDEYLDECSLTFAAHVNQFEAQVDFVSNIYQDVGSNSQYIENTTAKVDQLQLDLNWNMLKVKARIKSGEETISQNIQDAERSINDEIREIEANVEEIETELKQNLEARLTELEEQVAALGPRDEVASSHSVLFSDDHLPQVSEKYNGALIVFLVSMNVILLIACVVLGILVFCGRNDRNRTAKRFPLVQIYSDDDSDDKTDDEN